MAADELTQHGWEIAESLGKPRPNHLKVYEAVRDELRPYAWSVPAMQIANYAAKWVQTKNPHYMDAATIMCSQLGLPMTETLLAQSSAAASMRFNGSPMGTSESIVKENAHYAALMLMANMIFEETTQKLAASKAAKVTGTYKASTLERDYSKNVKRTGLQDQLFDSWRRDKQAHSEAWQPIIDALPETDEQDLGSRR